ncbi:MAG TPA: hypothetical protein VHD32_05645 [Candidatus Didemnitutus sp.]|nr:hypothetical protein [Candidatus Didemnitutus sp.]
MSSRAATLPASAAPATPVGNANLALGVGMVGIAVTAIGIFVNGGQTIALSWLFGLVFWTGIALGSLFAVMLHHIFDAGWSTVFRRQFEHLLAIFPWLALLFVPLLAVAWVEPSLLWKWMDPAFDLTKIGGHGTVGNDILWLKKSGFLNRNFFTLLTVGSFGIWWLFATMFRRNSFRQDQDGSPKWTISNRKWAAAGLPITALTLTACIILWVKSLEYHWFSTMYGVWFFANCMRAALSLCVVLAVWLAQRGDYKGVLNNNHLHCIGQLMLAFTVFWAYVTFSQYFLIWNANVPEETFWYNVREMNNSDGQFNQWGWIGMLLVFGHFLLPFLCLLSYRYKVTLPIIRRIAWWIVAIYFIDLCYNIMPSRKFANGDPYPFLQPGLFWNLTAVVGIGGIVLWVYLRSFATTKLIPIRDPRIVESLTHHEANAP